MKHLNFEFVYVYIKRAWYFVYASFGNLRYTGQPYQPNYAQKPTL